MVVLSILTQCGDLSAVPVDIHASNDIAVDAFQSGAAGEHVPVVLDLARLVIFCGKVQGFGFQSQVDVLRHQNDLRTGFIRLQTQGGIQDLVVVGAFREDVGGVRILAPGVHDNLQFTSKSIVQRNPVLKGVGITQFVQNANACARLEVFGFVAHFEAVELFEHRDGQGDFVLFEIGEGGVVKQQHTRVEHKNLGLHVTLFRSGLLFGRGWRQGGFGFLGGGVSRGAWSRSGGHEMRSKCVCEGECSLPNPSFSPKVFATTNEATVHAAQFFTPPQGFM